MRGGDAMQESLFTVAKLDDFVATASRLHGRFWPELGSSHGP
jgi:hypothetical protein